MAWESRLGTCRTPLSAPQASREGGISGGVRTAPCRHPFSLTLSLPISLRKRPRIYGSANITLTQL